MDKVILIAGPTASGKSALALQLAEMLGGVVINADSMQVYAEMRIITARPSAEDEVRAPHRLYGHVPAREPYSAAKFIVDAQREIGEARAAGRVPIIVGGTGLYFKALLEGLSPIPEIPADIRAHWRREGERVERGALHDVLQDRDPEMAARLGPFDTQRIVRALEVLDATGRSLAEWQRIPGTPVLTGDETIRLALRPDRALLHQRCDARFIAMVEGGAIGEARVMACLGLDPALPAMRAIGLRPLMQLVGGELGRDVAIERGQAETRQYVKRQDTWGRSNFVAWTTVKTNEIEQTNAEILRFIKR